MNANKQIVFALYQRFRNLILYGIIGSFSAGIDFLTFYILTTKLKVYYLYANIVSVFIGIIISFILNARYNFKIEDKVYKRGVIFIFVGLTGLLLSTAILYFFVSIFSLNKDISKLLSVVFVVFIQFLVNKYVTFKKEKYYER